MTYSQISAQYHDPMGMYEDNHADDFTEQGEATERKSAGFRYKESSLTSVASSLPFYNSDVAHTFCVANWRWQFVF